MAPHEGRWEGATETRIAAMEKQMEECWTRCHAMNNRIFVLELMLERNKGRLEGGKMVILLIGSLVGSVLGAVLTWMLGK